MNAAHHRPEGGPPGHARRTERTLDPLEWMGEARAEADVAQAITRQLKARRQRRLRGASLGIFFLAVFGAGWVALDRGSGTAPAATLASLAVHSPARQILPDGSVVELKDNARVAVEFTAAVRRVVLVQGEAFFSVAKNPQRPFVVVASGVEVRAIGTAFLVQRAPRSVEVVVNEGIVAVDPSPADFRSTDDAMLIAGERVTVALSADAPGTIAPQSTVESLSAAQLRARLAWRVPRLEFSGTTLAEALPLVNAHSATPLALGDPALGHLTLSGVLRADNVETLLELLAEAHGIRADRHGSEIVLRPRR